jgi:CRISPR type III-A-associated RAMP protein Csm4
LLPELASGQVNQEAKRAAEKEHVDFKWAKMKVIEGTKVWKEARYVSENLFLEIVLGQASTETLHRRLVGVGLKEEDVEQIGQVLMTTGERKLIEPDRMLSSFSLDADIQRNQIDRVAGATVEGLLFFDNQTFLHQEIAGLWFLMRTQDLDFLRPAFRYLADTGIGGRRSVGKGHFDIEIDEREQELPDAGNGANSFVVLSRYLPKMGECDFGERSPLSYTLLNLRSKHESRLITPEQPIYKEMVRVLAEGSILPLKERRGFYGRIEEVARLKGRRVWQNGLALPVFAHIKEDGDG